MKIKLRDVDQFNEMLIRKGFTKSELAASIELSVPRTIQISNGDHGPGVKVAKRICQTLEVEFDDVFKIVKTEQIRAESQAVAK
jgi:DNA-binding XRE family transcriptional regulator